MSVASSGASAMVAGRIVSIRKLPANQSEAARPLYRPHRIGTHPPLGTAGHSSAGIVWLESGKGLTSVGPLRSRDRRALAPEGLIHRINLSSPTLRVTCSRSRYSSNGIAYFLLTPVSSLNRATSIFGDLAFST